MILIRVKLEAQDLMVEWEVLAPRDQLGTLAQQGQLERVVNL